jgi:tetratricopeptide (TPR) repeat protein
MSDCLRYPASRRIGARAGRQVSDVQTSGLGGGARRKRYFDVFVSSTSRDLGAHREAVRRAIEVLRQHLIRMEDFGAQVGDGATVSTAEVASCDLFVLVVAWRYGFIPHNETRSITELEYLEARRLGRPCLICLSDESTQDQDGPGDLFPASLRDPEHATQLATFRTSLLPGHVVDRFTTPGSLYESVVRALSQWMLAQPEGPRPPRDVPAAVPDFVGRDSELDDLCARLRGGQSGGLSAAVLGMAGVGKSALAAEVLRALADDHDAFPGGITWVRCDGRDDLAGLAWVYDRILAAWEAPLSPEELARAQGPEDAAEARERALRNRLRPPEGYPPAAALVLLDNVELKLPLSRALDTLMPLGATVLVTARHRLGLPTLAKVSLEVLNPEPAVRLFAKRYAEAGGVWDAARDGPLATLIVGLLGRLPLAIELASAHATYTALGVAGLAAQLMQDDRLTPLNDPNDPTRSVRFAFERIYIALTKSLQAAFAALGLPDGPDWPRSVIEALLAGALEGLPDAPPPADALNTLAARSLLTLVAEAMSGKDVVPVIRVRLHPLLHVYAREQWAKLPTDRQHATLAALMEAVAQFAGIHDETSAHAFAILSREEELIAGAIRRAAETQIAPRALIAAVAALKNYYDIGGHASLGMELLALETEAFRASGDRAGEGRALRQLGELAQSQGLSAKAERSYQEALAIAREVGDGAGEGDTLDNLGLLADTQGQYQEAERSYQEALAIARKVDARSVEGHILNNMGLLARHLGRFEEAKDHYQEALAIAQQVGDRVGEGGMLSNLGELARRQGRYKEAVSYLEQALAIRREIGDRAGEAGTLNNLGSLARDQGRFEEAARYYQEGLVICREVVYRAGEEGTLSNSGLLAFLQGHYDEALRYQTEALTIAQEIGHRQGEALRHSSVADVYEVLGELEQACGHKRRALVIYEELRLEGDASQVRAALARLEATFTAPPFALAPGAPGRLRRRGPGRGRTDERAQGQSVGGLSDANADTALKKRRSRPPAAG